jgi:Lipopolysaccharide assembly protein A domain
MTRVVKAIVVVPLALVILVLAVANRADVVLVLDPFGFYEPLTNIAIPLYILLFIVAGLGVVAGGFGAWWSQRAARERARFFEREAIVLREELDQLRKLPCASSSASLPPSSMIR